MLARSLPSLVHTGTYSYFPARPVLDHLGKPVQDPIICSKSLLNSFSSEWANLAPLMKWEGSISWSWLTYGRAHLVLPIHSPSLFDQLAFVVGNVKKGPISLSDFETLWKRNRDMTANFGYNFIITQLLPSRYEPLSVKFILADGTWNASIPVPDVFCIWESFGWRNQSTIAWWLLSDIRLSVPYTWTSSNQSSS